MAFDFPASPTNGQVSNGYTWNAATGAWVGGPGAYLPLTGGTLSGDLTISKATPYLWLDNTNAPAGGGSTQFGLKRQGSSRWIMYSGAVSDNFGLGRYNDAGTLVDSPLTIDRTTGVVTATGLPPTPVSAAGVGQWVAFSGATGAAAILPAGGTWAWAAYRVNSGSGILSGILSVGVNSGGTTVLGALASYIGTGFCWRIA